MSTFQTSAMPHTLKLHSTQVYLRHSHNGRGLLGKSTLNSDVERTVTEVGIKQWAWTALPWATYHRDRTM